MRVSPFNRHLVEGMIPSRSFLEFCATITLGIMPGKVGWGIATASECIKCFGGKIDQERRKRHQKHVVGQ